MGASAIIDEIRAKQDRGHYVATCLQILEYMSRLEPEELRMLTFQNFVHALDKDTVDSDILAALAFLTNMRRPALIAKAMFVDEYDKEYEMELDELNLARHEGVLVHPDTGQTIDDFEGHVFPFFIASPEFLSKE